MDLKAKTKTKNTAISGIMVGMVWEQFWGPCTGGDQNVCFVPEHSAFCSWLFLPDAHTCGCHVYCLTILFLFTCITTYFVLGISKNII